MKLPSDAQAKFLTLVADHAGRAEWVEWLTNASETRLGRHQPSKAELYVERLDRERNVGRLDPVDEGRREWRLATVASCLRHGWLADGGERMHTRRWRAYSVQRKEHVEQSETWWLKQLDLTEDGVIALGLWRERKLQSPPPELPTLSEREREVIELAQRAHDLGYALCAREPARKEARQMRKAGWWDGCWVANSATGLVPSSLAVVEVFPERADVEVPA